MIIRKEIKKNITNLNLKQAGLLYKELNINDLIDNNINSNRILNKLINKKVTINFNYNNYYDIEIEYQGKIKIITVNDEFINVKIKKNY